MQAFSKNVVTVFTFKQTAAVVSQPQSNWIETHTKCSKSTHKLRRQTARHADYSAIDYI